MSLPGGYTGRRFWGKQLTVPEKRFYINVSKSTELHISKAILQFSKNPLELHNADRTINIFVEYFDVVRPDTLFATDGPFYNDDGTMTVNEKKELQTCLVCSLNTQNKREADLDLNFVAEKKNLFLYFQSDDSNCVIGATVNLSGYVVGG